MRWTASRAKRSAMLAVGTRKWLRPVWRNSWVKRYLEMGSNGYLARKNAMYQGFLDAGERLGMQKMWDYIQLTLRDPDVMGKDTFGKKRLEDIYKNINILADRYHICFTADKEADYYQEELDSLLRRDCDEFSPFYERYPQLKQFKYDRSRKGWK